MNKCSRSTAGYPRLWLDLPSALPGSLGVAVARCRDLCGVRQPRSTRRLHYYPAPLFVDLDATQSLTSLALELLARLRTRDLHCGDVGVGRELAYHLGGLTCSEFVFFCSVP